MTKRKTSQPLLTDYTQTKEVLRLIEESKTSKSLCFRWLQLVRDYSILLTIPDSLEKLDLRYIDAIKFLDPLPSSLVELTLCNVTSHISRLGNLPSSLLLLNLSESGIENISPLRNLPPVLQQLILNDNCIFDLTPLCNLPVSLRVLNLKNNPRLNNYQPLADQLLFLPQLTVISDKKARLDLKHPVRMARAILLVIQSRDILRLSTKSPLRYFPETGFPFGRTLATFLI